MNQKILTVQVIFTLMLFFSIGGLGGEGVSPMGHYSDLFSLENSLKLCS